MLNYLHGQSKTLAPKPTQQLMTETDDADFNDRSCVQSS